MNLGNRGGPAQSETKSTLFMILIGVGIGVTILIIVFGLLFFLNGRNKADEVAEYQDNTATTQQHTQAPTYEDRDRYDQTTRSYSYGDEEEIYADDAPEIFPDSSYEYLDESDLEGYSEDEIQKGINDIFARNGLIFESEPFKSYYYSQDWYEAESDDKDLIKSYMNEIENANIETLSDYIR